MRGGQAVRRPLSVAVAANASPTGKAHGGLVHWKKSPAALFSDSGCVAAGKRRDFCRLPRASFFPGKLDRLARACAANCC
jgi:hypothetical protein